MGDYSSCFSTKKFILLSRNQPAEDKFTCLRDDLDLNPKVVLKEIIADLWVWTLAYWNNKFKLKNDLEYHMWNLWNHILSFLFFGQVVPTTIYISLNIKLYIKFFGRYHSYKLSYGADALIIWLNVLKYN